MSTILDKIAERLPEALKADGFDEAVIGIAHRAGGMGVIAYDIKKCLKILRDRDGMGQEEAQEFFDFNVVDAYMGMHTPVFLEVVDTGYQNPSGINRYTEILDPSKQKRVRIPGLRQFYRYTWEAPELLKAQGFSALHAVFTIPSLGNVIQVPAGIVSPHKVWFESLQRIPYNTVLQITY